MSFEARLYNKNELLKIQRRMFMKQTLKQQNVHVLHVSRSTFLQGHYLCFRINSEAVYVIAKNVTGQFHMQIST